MSTSTFAAINAAFQQAFPPERFGSVVLMIRMLLDKPAGLSSDLETIPQAVIAYHLLRHVQQTMRRSALIRAIQYHELQRLEGLLRDDARASESHKYKQGAGTSKKQTAKEACETDTGRGFLLLKVVLFRQLLSRTEFEGSVTDLLGLSRAALEAEADTWSTNPAKQALVEAVADLKTAAEAELAHACGGASARAVFFQRSPASRSSTALPETMSMQPTWVRPRPTACPVSSNELRFLCAPGISSSVGLDAVAYSAEWKTVTSLIAKARQQALADSERAQVAEAASKCPGHFNLTMQVFLDLLEHNPQSAAQLLAYVPQRELYVDALLGLPNASGCLRSEVLLGCGGLQPHQLTAYVKAMCSHVRSQPAAQQGALVASFATTLHQLVKDQPMGKTETELTTMLFAEHAAKVPELGRLWPSLVKA